MIIKFFKNYYIIVNLYNGFSIKNIYFKIILLIMLILSILPKNNLLSEINNPILFNMVLFSFLCYIIYVLINFCCRLSITMVKGIPYFISEIRKQKM